MRSTDAKSKRAESWPTGPIVETEAPLVDERGKIQPLVEGGFRSAQLISSKAGSIRANHYHKTDFHYMYLLSGSFRYYYRPAGSNEQPKSVVVSAGQTVFTPPMIAHAVEFLEDTVFVNFAGNPRDRDAYESDLVRVEVIGPRK